MLDNSLLRDFLAVMVKLTGGPEFCMPIAVVSVPFLLPTPPPIPVESRPFSPEEKLILSVLSATPMPCDTVSRLTGIEKGKLSTLCANLAAAGIIHSGTKGYYRRDPNATQTQPESV